MLTGRRGVADCALAGDTGSDPGCAVEYVTVWVRPRRPDWVFDDRSPSRPGLPCQARPGQASSRCSELSSTTETDLVSAVCPRRVCRSGEGTAGRDGNTGEAGHRRSGPPCRAGPRAEQGRGGEGNSGRGAVEQAKGVGERGRGVWPARREWDGCAGNRQCSWLLGCPSGMRRRSNLSSGVWPTREAAGEGDGEREREQQPSLIMRLSCGMSHES